MVPRPRASGGSADAPSRTCANKRESLGAKDSLPHSTGGNVAATRVLPIAKASTPLASPPVGQAAGRDKRRRKARKSLKRAPLERCIWKDILLGSFVLSLRDVSRALLALWVAPLGDIGPSSTVVIEKSDENHADRQQPH